MQDNISLYLDSDLGRSGNSISPVSQGGFTIIFVVCLCNVSPNLNNISNRSVGDAGHGISSLEN